MHDPAPPAEYLPTEQSLQESDPAVELLPALHSSQIPAPWAYFPAEQREQVLDPMGDDLPASHAVQILLPSPLAY